MEVAPIGMHCILELHGCPPELLDNEPYILQAVRQACRASRSTLLKLSSHHFVPQGVTALALLGESHLSIHTWPEHGYAAVDIFTCGHRTDPVAACRSLLKSLSAERHRMITLRRGVREGFRPLPYEERINLCQAQP